MNVQGTFLEEEPRPLLNARIPLHGRYLIVRMSKDASEAVIMTGACLNIYRINCLVDQPTALSGNFSVQNASKVIVTVLNLGFLSHSFVKNLSTPQ